MDKTAVKLYKRILALCVTRNTIHNITLVNVGGVIKLQIDGGRLEHVGRLDEKPPDDVQ